MGNEEIKLPISADDIVYIENSKKTTKKNLNKKKHSQAPTNPQNKKQKQKLS